MRTWTVGLVGLVMLIGGVSWWIAGSGDSDSEPDPDPTSRLRALLREPFDLAEHSRLTAETSLREWGTSAADPHLCIHLERQGSAGELVHYESACRGTPLVHAVWNDERIFARRHDVEEWQVASAPPTLYREMLAELLQPPVESSQLADALDGVTSDADGDRVTYAFTLDARVIHRDAPEDLDMDERGTAVFDQDDRLVELTVHHSTELGSGFDLRTTLDYSSPVRIETPTPRKSATGAGRLATVEDLSRFLAFAEPP